MSKSLNNIKKICKDEFVKDDFPPDGRGICKIDMFIILQFAKYLGAKTVTEFGYGVSTRTMRKAGLSVTSFSLNVSDGGKKEEVDPEDYIKCNLFDENWRDRILAQCRASDLIVIDCLHTYAMAKYYSENFLNVCLKPAVIHDMTRPDRRNSYKEQDYIDRYLLGNTYEVFAYTDLNGVEKKMLKKILGPFPDARMAGLLVLPRG